MKHHVSRQGSCSKSYLDCDYKGKGCEFSGIRSDLEQHLESDVAEHLWCVVSDLDTARESIEEQENDIQSLESQFVEATREIKELKERLQKVEDGKGFVYWWPVVIQFRNGYTFSSPSFYTGNPGYHLRIDLKFNAERMSDVSLIVKAVEGYYDEELEWPFPYSFTLAIVEQEETPGNAFRLQFNPPFDGGLTGPNTKGGGSSCFIREGQLRRLFSIKDEPLMIQLCVNI